MCPISFLCFLQTEIKIITILPQPQLSKASRTFYTFLDTSCALLSSFIKQRWYRQCRFHSFMMVKMNTYNLGIMC